MHTLTEENYLKAIYRIFESTGDSVSTTAIADKLQINAASVTDMFKKLGQQKLVVYEKSRGVKPTEKGKKVALLDDVISTGSTLQGMRLIMGKAGAEVVADAAIFTEGDRAQWTGVIALGHLPVWVD